MRNGRLTPSKAFIPRDRLSGIENAFPKSNTDSPRGAGLGGVIAQFRLVRIICFGRFRCGIDLR
jgi:hypothetical protein